MMTDRRLFFACPLFSFLVCVRARVRACVCVCAVLQLRFDLCRPSPHFSTIVSWKEKYMCINIYIYIFNYCFNTPIVPLFLFRDQRLQCLEKCVTLLAITAAIFFQAPWYVRNNTCTPTRPLSLFFFSFFFSPSPHTAGGRCAKVGRIPRKASGS